MRKHASLLVSLVFVASSVARAEVPPSSGAEATHTGPIAAKSPPPSKPAQVFERVALAEAVRRALARNVDAKLAALEIDRAEALVRQARASLLPTLTANATYTRLDADRTRSGVSVAARDQLGANLQLSVPLITPTRWVQRRHIATGVATARADLEATHRTVALAVARSYLAVITHKRAVAINERAVATDRAHAAFAHTRLVGGLGNRIDDVRAGQQVAADQAALAASYTALARAREALGVLLGGENAIDVYDDPELPRAEPGARREDTLARRRDVLAAKQRVMAAEQVKSDSWVDYLPSLTGQFQPFYQTPPTLITPETGWQALLVVSVPLYDGGLRYGQRLERASVLAEARARYEGLLRQTSSELRVAIEAVRRAEEALGSAVEGAELAHSALELANLAYEAGATTNLEVIDAERRARDADTQAAIAEDNVRQARLDLLAASGQFPGT